MDGDGDNVRVTDRPLQKRARQPWAVHWWERCAPFSGKTNKAFPLGPGMPKAILTLPFCFLIVLISSLTLLPVWTYTLMQTDLTTRIHTNTLSWPMWCLLSIGANSFPLVLPVITLPRRRAARRHAGLRHCRLVTVPVCPLAFWGWPQHGSCCLQIIWQLWPEEAVWSHRWAWADDTHLLGNTTRLFQSGFFLFFSILYFCLSRYLHLSPASFHPELDLKFHSKGAISAPLVKWVIILLVMPTLNLYKYSHTSNSSPAS